MIESAIEQRLVREVTRRGGLCYKWVSPGASGVPTGSSSRRRAGPFTLSLRHCRASCPPGRSTCTLSCAVEVRMCVCSRGCIRCWIL